jgi:hypothetical protein
MFLDVLTTVFRIFVIAFMFAFLDSVTDKTVHLAFSIMATLCLMLSFVACIAVYINSWLKMMSILYIYIYRKFLLGLSSLDIISLPQLWARIRGRDNNDPRNDVKLAKPVEDFDVEDPTDKLD